MSNEELLFAASTLWVVFAAVLVMFMQAGFAFLEAGLTRMKNVGHVAAKNVLIFALASIVYYLVGFGMAFGDGGNGFIGGSGFAPSTDELLRIGQAPFSWFAEIPAAAGYLFEVVFAGVALAIVWGAMAERTKLWVYFAFGIVFTLIYSLVSHWIWSPDGWLFARGMQDFAGSTVVHYQGALAGLAGALLLGPRLGRFGADGRSNAIPGHNMAFTTLGVIILWFGWFGFNAGSTLSVQFGGLGFFAYVALNTNLAAAAGVIGAVITSWAVMKKPDLSMMLNGADRRARRDHGGVRLRRAVGRARHRLRRRHDRRARVAPRRESAHRRPRRSPRGARNGRSLGNPLARLPHRAEPRGEARHRQGWPALHGICEPARHAGRRAARRRRLHVRRLVPRALGDEVDVRHPHRRGVGGGGSRRVRARHVGLSGALQPRPGWLRNRRSSALGAGWRPTPVAPLVPAVPIPEPG